MVEKGDAAVWGQRFQLDNSLSASLLSGTVDPGTSCTRFHAASSSFSLNILQCEIQLRGVPQFHCTTSSSNRRNDSFFHRPLCGLCSPAPVLVAGYRGLQQRRVGHLPLPLSVSCLGLPPFT